MYKFFLLQLALLLSISIVGKAQNRITGHAIMNSAKELFFSKEIASIAFWQNSENKKLKAPISIEARNLNFKLFNQKKLEVLTEAKITQHKTQLKAEKDSAIILKYKDDTYSLLLHLGVHPKGCYSLHACKLEGGEISVDASVGTYVVNYNDRGEIRLKQLLIDIGDFDIKELVKGYE